MVLDAALLNTHIYIYKICQWRCLWCNGYHHKK